MKKLLSLGIVLTSAMTFAGTELTYNSVNPGLNKVVHGNILFSGVGMVSADQVCFDTAANLFKTFIPSRTLTTCSIKALPVSICVENGGNLESVVLPAKELTAERNVNVAVCDEYDRTDSTHPVCTHSVMVAKAQPLDYTFMKYSVETTYYYNDFPAIVTEKTMAICK